MKTIEIIDVENKSIIKQLNAYIEGNIEYKNGEESLIFNNSIGSGTIRNIKFDWGIALLDYDVNFNDDVKIIFNTTKGAAPIEFLFISEGNLTFNNTDDKNYVRLERFQNIIISNNSQSRSIYVFPSKINVKLNIIHVFSKKFMKKKNHQVDTLEDSLLSVFERREENLPFKHIGNYNLTIAEKIKTLNEFGDSGIIKSLSIEGQLNLILAMQMLEHKKYENDTHLTDSLTISEIKKIHGLVDFIIDNVSKPLTIKSLTKESGLGPKKLQLGFKLLFSKSINEYIRSIKLKVARDMIKDTDKSISEIVYEIGYRSRSYFSKIFYEQYNILPIDYKENLKTQKSRVDN
ncbi:helix-turn-helix transcriptional regulator [uncultured Psychroserpens sp.]|uniref:helix-turn-helix transcriptional regulator n=1 Tax=uncultured Psychroserpens sp. TaxID=255436 RepID=UPI00262E770B|nr:helix-turn-helix transcriptional regulator [uncultured Psychroserpens sp.]